MLWAKLLLNQNRSMDRPYATGQGSEVIAEIAGAGERQRIRNDDGVAVGGAVPNVVQIRRKEIQRSVKGGTAPAVDGVVDVTVLGDGAILEEQDAVVGSTCRRAKR